MNIKHETKNMIRNIIHNDYIRIKKYEHEKIRIPKNLLLNIILIYKII